MTKISLHIKSSKNQEAIMTPRDLLDLYLYGITAKAADGSTIPDHIYQGYILFAQQEMEKYLGIKLKRQIIEEDQNFYQSDVIRWNMIQTSYPVAEVRSMIGHYGNQQHIEIPKHWLSTKTSSDGVYYRAVHIVPNGVGNFGLGAFINGELSPFLMMGNAEIVPNYWKIRYVTGYSKPPMDIYDLIGKLSAINVLGVLGDLVLGNGISSQSIGIDGLSQSLSTTKSGTTSAYGARIKQYQDDLRNKLPIMKDFYGGIRFTCV